MPEQYTDKKNRTYRVIHKSRYPSETEEKQKVRQRKIVAELMRIFGEKSV